MTMRGDDAPSPPPLRGGDSPSPLSSHIGDVVSGEPALRAEIECQRLEIEGLRAENGRLALVVGEISEVKENARILIRRMAEQREENEQLQLELEDLQQNYDILFDEMEARPSRGEENLAGEPSEIQESFAVARDASQETIASLKKENSAMVREVERLNAREGDLAQAAKKNMSARNEALRSLEDQCKLNGKLQVEVERLRAEMATSQHQIEECQAISKDKEERNEALRREAEQSNAQLAECKAAMEDQSKLNVTLQLDLRIMADERDKALERAAQDKAQRQIEGYKTTVVKEAERSGGLRREAEGLRSELGELTGQRDVALRRALDLEGENEGLRQGMADAEAAMQKSERELRGEMENLVGENEMLRREKADSEAAMQKLERELRGEMENLGEENELLRREKQKTERGLKQRITDAEGKNEQLRREAADAEAARRKTEGELRREMEGYKSTATNESERNQQLRLEADRANAQVETCKVALDLLGQGLAKAEGALKEKELEMRRRAGEYEAALQREGEIKRELQVVAERAEARAAVIEARAAEDRSGQIEALRRDFAAMRGRRDEARRRVAHLEGEIDLMRREMERYETTVANEAERSRALRKEAERANAQAEECRAAAENQSALNDRLAGERDEARGRVSDLEGRIAALEADAATAEAAARDKERELRRQIEGYKRTMLGEVERRGEARRAAERANERAEECMVASEDQSERNRTLRSDVDRLTSEKEEALRHASGLEGEIDSLRQELANAEAAFRDKEQDMLQRIEEYETNSGALQRELEQANARAEESRAAAEDQSEQNRTLRSDYDRLTGEKEEALRRASDLEGEIDSLRQELADAERAAQETEWELRREVEGCQTAATDEAEKSGALRLEADRANVWAEGIRSAAEEQSALNQKLRSDLEAMSERDEAQRCFADLKSEVDVLKVDVANAEAAIQDKEQEMQQRIEENEATIMNEAEKGRSSQLEAERANALAEESRAAAEEQSELNQAMRMDLEAMAGEKNETQRCMKNLSELNGTLQSDLERMTVERDEALRCTSDLEIQIDLLRHEISNAEAAIQDKEQDLQKLIQGREVAFNNELERSAELQLEVERLNDRVEESKVASADESKFRKMLQSDLERVTCERDEALTCTSELESRIKVLREELAEAEGAMRNNDLEMCQRMEQYETSLKDETEKSGKWQSEAERADAQCGEFKAAVEHLSELNRTLQSNLERATREKDEASARATRHEGEIDLMKRELDHAEASTEAKEQEAQRQIEVYRRTIINETKKSAQLQLEVDRANAQVEECKASTKNQYESNRTLQSEKDEALACTSDLEGVVEEKNQELRRLSALMDECKAVSDDASLTNIRLQLNLDLMTKERDELADKVDQLSQDLLVAKNAADRMAQDKNRELLQLRKQMGEHKAATDAESESKRMIRSELEQITSERDQFLRCNSQFISKADQLEQDANIADINAKPSESRSGSNYENGSVHLSNGGDGLHSTIDQTQMTTNGATSDGSLHHRANRRIESIFSRFGSRRSAEGSDVESLESAKGTVHESEQVKNEPGTVLPPKTNLVQGIKCLMKEMRIPEEGSALDKVSLLRNTFTSLVNERDKCLAEVATLQATVEDLESTLSLQTMQNNTLKEEVTGLQNMVNDTETRKSSLEDNVEELKAKILKLELMSRLREEENKSMEEALATEVDCRDFAISSLIPRLTKMRSVNPSDPNAR